MREVIIHIVPEWPSYSQTFVQDDIEISKKIFKKVYVFPLPMREQPNPRVIRDLLLIIANIPKIVILLKNRRLRKELGFQFQNIHDFRGHILQFYKLFCAGVLLSKFDLHRSSQKTIIHAHFLSTGLEIALLAKSINSKLVVFATGHGSDVFFKKERSLLHYISKVDCVFAASQAVQKRLELQAQLRDIAFKPPIILRYCRVPALATETVDFRSKFGSNKTSIVTVARFHPQKGLLIAIETAKNLRDKEIDFSWDFIGDGQLRCQLEDLVHRYRLAEHVNFLGVLDRKNVLTKLAKSDIFVLSSIRTSNASDGLPVAILEAMSLGTYVVSSDVGGISEALNLSRGSLIEPNSNLLSVEIEKVIKRGKSNFHYLENALRWVSENCAINSKDPLYKTYLKFRQS